MENNEINNRVNKVYELKKFKSKTEFAKTLGIERVVVTNILLGKREPSKEVILKLIEVLGVNPNWLLIGKGSVFQEESEEKRLQMKLDEAKERIERLEKEKKMLENTEKDLDRQIQESNNQIDKLKNENLGLYRKMSGLVVE